ncbi:MAG: AAA family ATPase [Promethearchaeota archaeon]
MILKSIEVKNIRSIKSLKLEFPQSTVLFFGDVGSGKSSILKSIEFALFGTLIHGDLSGDSLLRRGERKASVKLTFSIEGKEYSIKRSLTKGRKGKISQDESVFTDYNKGVETSFAPTDMRRKILSLLSYSISRYERASKLPLFRYTVYTPQEQVKEIIEADTEQRFEILKEVFGIEKYEIALKNMEIIKEFLNDKLKESKIKLEQLGEPEEDILHKEKELKHLKTKIDDIESELIKKDKEINSQDKITEKVQKELQHYTNRIIQIENKESNIIEYKKNQQKNKALLGKVRKDISQKEVELGKLKSIKLKTELTEDQLEKKLENIQNQIIQKEKELARLNEKLTNVDKLLKEGKCSLCGQAIHEKERFEKELQKSTLSVKKITNEISKLDIEIEKHKQLIKNRREYQKIKDQRDLMQNLISEMKKREDDLAALVEDLFSKINESQNEIIAILSDYKIQSLEKFKKTGKEIEEKLTEEKSRLNNLTSEKQIISNELSVQRKNLEYLQKDLEEIKSNLQEKEILQEKLLNFSELINWVSNEFPVLIRDIEMKILSSSAQHFNSYFTEWFHELVEDRNIEVEIRPGDFQPLIYVNGYESPFNDLSGGEKSGLSLAYRLALNKIINERHQEVKTKNILILDEPTDGFSQQQINRMQPVFESLDISQMIIISHERNLDSFVTDIFHFEKENHITKVTREIT